MPANIATFPFLSFPFLSFHCIYFHSMSGWYWLMVISYPRYMFRAALKVIVGPLYDPTTGLTGSQYIELLFNINDSLYNQWMDWGIVMSFYAAFALAAGAGFVYFDWFIDDESEAPFWGVLETADADADADIAAAAAGQKTSSTSITVNHDAEAGAGHDADQGKTKGKAYIQWQNLCYDVTVEKEGGGTMQKRLLDNVYGYCTPGESMGVSEQSKHSFDILFVHTYIYICTHIYMHSAYRRLQFSSLLTVKHISWNHMCIWSYVT
jgi:hypothetical protein